MWLNDVNKEVWKKQQNCDMKKNALNEHVKLPLLPSSLWRQWKYKEDIESILSGEIFILIRQQIIWNPFSL